MEKLKIYAPLYVEKFNCIGGECEDNCCIGWDIDVDQATFRRYHKIKEEPYRSMFNKYIINNKEYVNKDLDYGRIKLNKEKRCPFLDECNYCNIHKKYGHEYLGSVCSQYPRVMNRIDDFYEMSLDLGCPEAARIILSTKERIALKEISYSTDKYTLAGYLETNSEEFKYSSIRYFKEIRDYSLKIVQNRNYDISTRLYILGRFLDNVQETEVNDILIVIKDFNMNKMAEEYEKDDMNYALQVSFLKNIIDELDIINETDSVRFRNFTVEALEGFGIDNNEDIVNNSSKIISMYKRYVDDCITKYDYVLENYLVNFIYNNLFPFSESDYEFDGYILLVVRYSLIRFYLVGRYINSGRESEASMIELIQVFVKAVEHDRNYRSEILDYLKENDFDNIMFAKMLL